MVEHMHHGDEYKHINMCMCDYFYKNNKGPLLCTEFPLHECY